MSKPNIQLIKFHLKQWIFFFDKNEIIIHKNVEYIGIYGKLISDNIKINLYTKKIDIYMDHQNARVEIQNIR